MKTNNLKIGVIGLGSIGLRHVNELIVLGITKIYALRTNKGSKDIPGKLDRYITNVLSESEFLDLELDGYIISNPTSLHCSTINLLAKLDKPMFVEKPICSTQKEIDSLKNINVKKIQIGFCLRFHEVTEKINEVIKSNILGDIYLSKINVGQYLPSWHPYTDYRTEYFSQKELGGGAIRTLSHEIDLALSFFGNPISHQTIAKKVSDLEINVDDYSLVLLNFKNHLSRIEIDFLNKKKERNGVFFGTKGDLHYDFFKNTIQVFNNEGVLVIDETVPKKNMYFNQMKAFVNLIQTFNFDEKMSTFEQSVLIQKIIDNG